MAFTKEQHREYRKKLKKEGVCPVCRKGIPEKGNYHCRKCIQNVIERNKIMYKKRFDAGLCRRCGIEKDDKSKVLCVNCTENDTYGRLLRRSLKS